MNLVAPDCYLPGTTSQVIEETSLLKEGFAASFFSLFSGNSPPFGQLSENLQNGSRLFKYPRESRVLAV